jgi:hypothetical protein
MSKKALLGGCEIITVTNGVSPFQTGDKAIISGNISCISCRNPHQPGAFITPAFALVTYTSLKGLAALHLWDADSQYLKVNMSSAKKDPMGMLQIKIAPDIWHYISVDNDCAATICEFARQQGMDFVTDPKQFFTSEDALIQYRNLRASADTLLLRPGQ